MLPPSFLVFSAYHRLQISIHEEISWSFLMGKDYGRFHLAGQTAFVTGGARNLGFSMAMALAEAGADVGISSRNEAEAKAAAETIARKEGVKTFGVAMDVRDTASLEKAAAAMEANLAPPDILINNAGGTMGSSPRHLFERSPEDIRDMLETNLLGTILCTRQFARPMVRRKYGKIINIASVAALLGRDREVYQTAALPAQPVEYAAAKAGVLGFTTDCAALFARDGVCVNAISPGGFEREGMPEEFRRLYSQRTALGRMGDEQGSDLGGAVVFLASRASDYVTGHNLVVDGGFSFWK